MNNAKTKLFVNIIFIIFKLCTRIQQKNRVI